MDPTDSKPEVLAAASESGAQTPIALRGTKLGHRSKVAAGFKAIEETIEYGLRDSGLKNTLGTFNKLNQVNGFDCQSCAWPNPDGERSFAEFCENGFKAVTYEATTKRIAPEFFQKHSVADLLAKSEHWLGHQGRITEPMVLEPGASHYRRISWDDAFGIIATELKALKSPDEAVFYTSGRTSNEAAFLYQLFVRTYGTNNLPDCSNMCHESTSVALPPMIGIGKGCVKLHDLEIADLIIIAGQNPGTNHPRMLTSLQKAKENGCKVIFVNPLPETGAFRFKNPQDLLHPTRIPRFVFGKGTQISDLWLPVRINGDMAFFQGLMKELLDAEDQRPGEVFDHDFIRQQTQGYDELIAQLRRSSWDEIVVFSGLSRKQIREAAEMVLASRRIIVCWCMGLTQHRNAVASIQDIINFLLLTGNIGRPGSGPCPVRGHSNVQGDRTMGIWDKPKKEFLAKLGKEFSFDPPQKHGMDAVETIRAMN
jgi:molybdopterin-dependent oxidoreductase alpha subunit